MYNLLLIANDQHAIDTLKNLISWEDFGFRQINSAMHLSQINRQFSTSFPSLVIIDAQFREAEAINIMQEIRRCSQDTQIILVTSERDFELAQSAINLQVAALLLWERLSPTRLTGILDRIVILLDDRFHRQGIIKRQLFRDILKGKLPTGEEIERYFEIREPNANYIMFLIKRDLPDSVISADASPGADYYAVNWHGSNFPEELSYIATVNISMHVWCSLLKIRKVHSMAKVHAVSHAAAMSLQCSFKHQFQDTVSIASSRPFSNFNATLPAVKQLDDCLNMQKYYGRARLCSYSDYRPPTDSCEELLHRMGEGFSSAMQNERAGDAVLRMEQLFEQLEKGYYHYSCVSQACRLLTAILNGYCLKKGIAALEERLIHGKLPGPYCYGVAEMAHWFRTVINLLIKESGKSVKVKYSQKVQAVMDYLEQNYGENTDVNSLASQFHISSDYLRHLFKRETGENLTGYITHVKIGKAKLLLSTGNYKINEVAQMTGFNTSQYFGTVFRKQTGITPREFIRQCKENPWGSLS